jgi:molybdopterin converting factor small subunit
MTDKAKTDAPKTVTVELNQAHTHQRENYKMGDKIQVLPHVADYLEAENIGKRV